MRKALILVLGMMAVGLIAREPVEPIEFITYNIRLNTSGDGEHAWPHRKADVVNLLRFHRADVFCVQEALPDQVDDLSTAFPDFHYEGIGRDDGKREGEFSAVFYSRERFKKLKGGTFWLSESPDECSFGWDAACRRVCTWVELEDRMSGQTMHVFNTHFDHKGKEARKNSAQLILDRIASLTVGAPGEPQSPVILCGDFNLSPDSEPIKLIQEELRDAFWASELPPHGSVATYHGFTYDDPPRERIDYVFVSEGMRVSRYAALTDSRNQVFFSDHLPVLVTLENLLP